MRFTRGLGLLLLLAVARTAVAVSEDETLIGWHDFHLKVMDEKSADLVKKFVEENDCLIVRESHNLMPEDVLVRPKDVEKFTQLLKSAGVEFDVPDTDIGSLLLKEKMQIARKTRNSRADPSVSFVQSKDVYAWMRSLAAQYPSVLKVENYGISYEKRELLMLKMSTDWNANKPIIFVDAAIHAREWLAPAALCNIIKAFLANQNEPMLAKYDWYFVPVVNPDGYDYTFRSSLTRFWRKTRHPYGRYFGADPNRNFDFQFGGPSTSNNPASDLYHGPEPFSEPETLALSNYLKGIKSRLVKGMYVSFHTYGQLWLTPPGYTRILPEDHSDMVKVATAGNNALNKVNGRSFKIGQPANVGLYEAAGGSYDWVKFVLGVKYAFTLELFPQWPAGIGGFVADVSEIPKSGAEVFAALKASAAALP